MGGVILAAHSHSKAGSDTGLHSSTRWFTYELLEVCVSPKGCSPMHKTWSMHKTWWEGGAPPHVQVGLFREQASYEGVAVVGFGPHRTFPVLGHGVTRNKHTQQ